MKTLCLGLLVAVSIAGFVVMAQDPYECHRLSDGLVWDVGSPERVETCPPSKDPGCYRCNDPGIIYYQAYWDNCIEETFSWCLPGGCTTVTTRTAQKKIVVPQWCSYLHP